MKNFINTEKLVTYLVAIVKLVAFIVNGKFISDSSFRKTWKLVSYIFIFWMVFRYIIAPIFYWWGKLIGFMNYVIWG